MMNTNKYGLEYAGPRRARRGALRQWLLDLIIGAVTMALLWWLFALVSRAATKGDVMPGMRAAGFGVPEWLAVGIVVCVVLGVLARLWCAKVLEAEEMSTYSDEAWDPYAGERPGCGRVRPSFVPPPPPVNRVVQANWTGISFGKADPLADGDTLKREQRAIEAMPAGVTRLDVALICFALASETRLIRELVRGAQRSHGAEDYGDALAGAERRLGDLRTRLWQLKAHFDGGLIQATDADDLPRTYGEAATMMNAGGRL